MKTLAAQGVPAFSASRPGTPFPAFSRHVCQKFARKFDRQAGGPVSIEPAVRHVPQTAPALRVLRKLALDLLRKTRIDLLRAAVHKISQHLKFLCQLNEPSSVSALKSFLDFRHAVPKIFNLRTHPVRLLILFAKVITIWGNARAVVPRGQRS